jgi:hypothetical protein
MTAVDGKRRSAMLGDGTELPYDALIMATGRRVRALMASAWRRPV